jgi:hypothetical protein
MPGEAQCTAQALREDCCTWAIAVRTARSASSSWGVPAAVSWHPIRARSGRPVSPGLSMPNKRNQWRPVSPASRLTIASYWSVRSASSLQRFDISRRIVARGSDT